MSFVSFVWLTGLDLGIVVEIELKKKGFITVFSLLAIYGYLLASFSMFFFFFL